PACGGSFNWLAENTWARHYLDTRPGHRRARLGCAAIMAGAGGAFFWFYGWSGVGAVAVALLLIAAAVGVAMNAAVWG
ncbi:MAG: hypothetical protein AAF790_00005, partial [Planctomycetota bacterium]